MGGSADAPKLGEIVGCTRRPRLGKYALQIGGLDADVSGGDASMRNHLARYRRTCLDSLHIG